MATCQLPAACCATPYPFTLLLQVVCTGGEADREFHDKLLVLADDGSKQAVPCHALPPQSNVGTVLALQRQADGEDGLQLPPRLPCRSP